MERSVLITGASSGIGAATAARLGDAGFRVFGTSRKPSEDVAGPIEWIPMDVCDEASVRDGVGAVLERTERLDALVCNAGFGIFGSIEEVSIEDAQAQFDTNFFGVLRVLRAVVPHMREARAGRLALVGSLSGRVCIPFQAHYSASKAAVDSLSWGLYNELRPFGIHVSLIEPGDINTPFNDAMAWDPGEGSAYGDAIRACEAVVRESLPKAPGPEIVADVIYTALTAARPRVRYPVGPDSRLVPFGRRFLPDWLNLSLIRSHFKLP